MGRLSINQRLKKAKSAETKQKILDDWTDNWRDEHDHLIAALERAVRNDDYDLMCISLGQLKAMNAKRFDALPKVLTNLLGADPEASE